MLAPPSRAGRARLERSETPVYDNGGVTPILPRALALPDFPWDSLRPYRVRAARHPGGVVDLAVGTPVDESPDVARAALAAASDAPGYPATVGTPALREAVIGWMERRRGVAGLSDDAVIPTIGSKESVALLPLQLGAGPGDIIVHPRAAYPTYDVGARLAGATPVPVDTDADPDTWNPRRPGHRMAQQSRQPRRPRPGDRSARPCRRLGAPTRRRRRLRRVLRRAGLGRAVGHRRRAEPAGPSRRGRPRRRIE